MPLTVDQVRAAFGGIVIDPKTAKQMATQLAADTTEAGADHGTWCQTHTPDGPQVDGSACYRCTPDTLTQRDFSFCTICCQSQEEQDEE